MTGRNSESFSVNKLLKAIDIFTTVSSKPAVNEVSELDGEIDGHFRNFVRAHIIATSVECIGNKIFQGKLGMKDNIETFC